jgi:hypothetical protein
MTTTDWIQAISASIAAIVTIVLARITYIYVRETKRMAKAAEEQSKTMQKEFEIRLMPLVEEEIEKKESSIERTTIELTIINSGFYPVFCINASINIFQKDHRNEILKDTIDFRKWLEKDGTITGRAILRFGDLPAFRGNHPPVKTNKMITMDMISEAKRLASPINNSTAIITFHYRSVSNTEFSNMHMVDY